MVEMKNNTQPISPTQSAPIQLTPAAIRYVRKKLSSQASGEGLRIGLKKSGCSGWLYTFDYGRQTGNEEATFMVANDIPIIISQQHLKIFKGTIIDYVKSGLNAHLTCLNPNEIARCGCGESVSLSE